MQIEYLLDTDICVYIANQTHATIFDKLNNLKIGQIGMSIITAGELLYGACKSVHVKKNHQMFEDLSQLITPLTLPLNSAKIYGEIRSNLEKQGKPIGQNDLWIAAHALALDVILVTNNIKEFSRIPQLKLENWVAA